jgi:hypothetical protein
MVTDQARMICDDILPEVLEGFLLKNRKYRSVDNSLGARGVFPDVHRKVGILKDRIWDGSDVYGESTAEVIDDLIGHLFLMRYMLATSTGAGADGPTGSESPPEPPEAATVHYNVPVHGTAGTPGNMNYPPGVRAGSARGYEVDPETGQPLRGQSMPGDPTHPGLGFPMRSLISEAMDRDRA